MASRAITAASVPKVILFPAKPRGDELPLGDGADNRQEVGCFDDLPGPALGDARLVRVASATLPPRCSSARIVDLTGLVIRAAGNGERLAVHVVEAQVVIRTVCIPEERCFVWFWVWFPAALERRNWYSASLVWRSDACRKF